MGEAIGFNTESDRSTVLFLAYSPRLNGEVFFILLGDQTEGPLSLTYLEIEKKRRVVRCQTGKESTEN